MVRRSPSSSRSTTAGSWLALLAATTLGGGAGTVCAQIRADGLSGGVYRLVVQSYDSSDGRVPGRHCRPVGSAQRVVTADELKEGVRVPLLELRSESSGPAVEPVVVAWLEASGPDLEFDARSARPSPGSVFGTVKRGSAQDVVEISLNRRA